MRASPASRDTGGAEPTVRTKGEESTTKSATGRATSPRQKIADERRFCVVPARMAGTADLAKRSVWCRFLHGFRAALQAPMSRPFNQADIPARCVPFRIA